MCTCGNSEAANFILIWGISIGKLLLCTKHAGTKLQAQPRLYSEMKASLGYLVSSRIDWATNETLRKKRKLFPYES
jgi:hypothetical protein